MLRAHTKLLSPLLRASSHARLSPLSRVSPVVAPNFHVGVRRALHQSSAKRAAAPSPSSPSAPTSSTPSPPPPPSPPPSSPPRRRWLRVALWGGLVLVAGSSGALVYISRNLEPSEPLRQHTGGLLTFANALVRLWRDLYCATMIVADYEWSLRGLEGAAASAKLKEVHARSALRLRDMMRANGGIYIKFGQHIAQLQYLLPEEYVRAMQPMLNDAPRSGREDVERVFREEIGRDPLEVFESFDFNPVASASLAQVHFATLRRPDTGKLERVAVKIQHAALQHNTDSDIASVRFIINFIHKIEPRFD